MDSLVEDILVMKSLMDKCNRVSKRLSVLNKIVEGKVGDACVSCLVHCYACDVVTHSEMVLTNRVGWQI